MEREEEALNARNISTQFQKDAEATPFTSLTSRGSKSWFRSLSPNNKVSLLLSWSGSIFPIKGGKNCVLTGFVEDPTEECLGPVDGILRFSNWSQPYPTGAKRRGHSYIHASIHNKYELSAYSTPRLPLGAWNQGWSQPRWCWVSSEDTKGQQQA